MAFHKKRTENLVKVEALYAYYEPERVEGYCQGCQNYGKIWSCPPHPFTAKEFLAPYTYALVIGEEIFAEEGVAITQAFQEARRQLGDELIGISKSGPFEVLIAGNCYLCESCQRLENKPCVHPNACKYSLESIGFLVGDIAKEILNEPLKWGKSGEEPKSLMTVAVILSSEKASLEALKK